MYISMCILFYFLLAVPEREREKSNPFSLSHQCCIHFVDYGLFTPLAICCCFIWWWCCWCWCSWWWSCDLYIGCLSILFDKRLDAVRPSVRDDATVGTATLDKRYRVYVGLCVCACACCSFDVVIIMMVCNHSTESSEIVLYVMLLKCEFQYWITHACMHACLPTFIHPSLTHNFTLFTHFHRPCNLHDRYNTKSTSITSHQPPHERGTERQHSISFSKFVDFVVFCLYFAASSPSNNKCCTCIEWKCCQLWWVCGTWYSCVYRHLPRNENEKEKEQHEYKKNHTHQQNFFTENPKWVEINNGNNIKYKQHKIE